MNPIDKLTEYFKEFPGIGPRQAKRFTYFLLRKSDSYINELGRLIPELKKNISQCNECFRFFTRNSSTTCNICSSNRNQRLLMIVARDVDFEAVQKSSEYDGYYFILGGQIPVLEKNPENIIRIKELKNILTKRKEKGLEEVILAMNANPDGDYTGDYLRKELESFNLKISTLGRGLSTGTELEYSDTDTISNALKNRG